MRPLKLKIEGIKSFTDMQEIDFAMLSENKLFGIFGDTASGKSTILSSMILALYGEDDSKIHQRDFINMNRSEANIELEFLINDCGKPEVYRCERSFRIRSGSGTYDNKARLLRAAGGGYMVEEDTIAGVNRRIESIIGLSLAEFKKCVILPQGEFASFLKATPIERLQIIGKLFDLEKYGDVLFGKVRDYRSERAGELSLAEATVEIVGDFDYKEIDTQKALQKQLTLQLEQLEKDSLKTKDKLNKISGDMQVAEQYAAELKIKEDITAQAPKMQELEKRLQKGEAARFVTPFITAAADARQALLNAQKEHSLAEAQLKGIEGRHGQAQQAAETAKKDYDDNFIKDNQRIATLIALRPGFLEIEQIDNGLKLARGEYQAADKAADESQKNIQIIDNKLKDVAERMETAERFLSGDEQAMENLRRASYYNGRASEAEYASDRLKGTNHSGHFSERREDFNKKAQGFDPDGGRLGDDTRAKLKAEVADLKKQQQTLDGQRTAYLQASAAAKQKLQNISDTGKDLKQRRQDILKRLEEGGAQTFNLTEFDGYTAKLTRQNEQRQQLKDGHDAKLEQLNKELQGSRQNHAAIKRAIQTYQDSVQKQEQQLSMQLKAQGFDTAESCRAALLSAESAEEIKARCKQYNDAVSANSANLTRLKPLYDKIDIKEQDYRALKEQDKKQDAAIRQYVQQIEKADSGIESLIQRREKLEDAKKDIRRIKAQLDTADSLYNLTKGKRFMEFAAEEFIVDITKSATEYIARLSAGRYRLIYTQGGFYVEDNYSGGVKRKVITLSGGETFLVSLSLAVALSEAIAKRSDKAMEFFFLDEGFGTLDNELCDMVMQSLERLRQSHFTIGLISHVPELRHRLDFKLDVTAPTDSTGSRVEHVRP